MNCIPMADQLDPIRARFRSLLAHLGSACNQEEHARLAQELENCIGDIFRLPSRRLGSEA